MDKKLKEQIKKIHECTHTDTSEPFKFVEEFSAIIERADVAEQTLKEYVRIVEKKFKLILKSSCNLKEKIWFHDNVFMPVNSLYAKTLDLNRDLYNKRKNYGK